MADLFTPVVPEGELNGLFRRVRSEDVYASTRSLMNEIFRDLPNPDPHFVKEFQTHGFDARVWELYLFALKLDGPWRIARPHDAPDYLFLRDGAQVWVEAVIAGPAQKIQSPEEDTNIQEFLDNGLAIRYGTPLGRKLAKAYWNMEHVAGQPLVIALADFAERDPFRWNHHALSRYLYGVDSAMDSKPGEPVTAQFVPVTAHVHGLKVVPSGFFGLPGAENISAVLFSNAGTISKFHRKAFDPAVDRNYRMVRHGFCADPRPDSPLPEPFSYVVSDAVDEKWIEGSVVLHNPNTKVPVPREFFHGMLQYWRLTDRFDIDAPDFHPQMSVTGVFRCKDGDVDDEFESLVDRLADYFLLRTQLGQDDLAETYRRHAELLQKAGVVPS